MTSDTYTPRNQAGTRVVPGGISARNWNNTTSEWVLTGLFFLVLSYAAMVLVPAFVQGIEPGPALDECFALNHFIHTQFKFGPDLIFTYGPMGFVPTPQPGNLAVALSIKLAVWLILLWQLAQIWRSGRHFSAMVLTLSLVASNEVYFYYWDYLVAMTILVVLVRMLPHQIDYSGIVLLVLLTGFLFLVKFPAFIMAVACIVVFTLPLLGPGNNASRGRPVALLLAIVLAGPIAYLIYNPSIPDLILYAKGAYNIIAGYAAAESLPTDPLNVKIGVILCGTLAASILFTLCRRVITARGAAVVLIAGWVAFRHGYVRSHANYVAVFCCLAIFLFAVLLAQIDSSRLEAKILTLVFVLFIVVAMLGVAERWKPQSVEWWLPKTKGSPLDLVHWRQAVRSLNRQDDPRFDSTTAYIYKDVVKGKRVLCFPLITDPVHGEFEVVPLYTVMAYDAYTRYLDRRSANNISAAQPPLDNIIFEWVSNDGRHPLLDVPAVWSTLFADFAPQLQKGDSLLLAPRRTPLHLVYTPLSATGFTRDRWVSIPWSTTPVAMSIDLRLTIFGAILKSAYKQAPVYAEIRTLSGNTQRFRVPVDVLATPVLINVLPLSFKDATALWTTNAVRDPIIAFRLLGDGLAHVRSSQYHFYRVDGTSITVTAHSPAVSSSLPRGTVQAQSYGGGI